MNHEREFINMEPEVIPEVEANDVENSVESIGVVANCSRLNIRRYPSAEADIVCEIKAGTEVMIVEDESTDEFYKIYTMTGLEGFCMKNYINVLQ